VAPLLELDHQEPSQAQPAWYVRLRFWWQCPLSHTPLYQAIALVFFLEQASIQAGPPSYRQRLLEIIPPATRDALLQVQSYMLRARPADFRGAGREPHLWHHLNQDDIQRLPGCLLLVTPTPTDAYGYQLDAQPPHQHKAVLPLEEWCGRFPLVFWQPRNSFGVTTGETGYALWGALLGSYQLAKVADFIGDLPATTN